MTGLALPDILASPQLYVRQKKEWAEIIVDWETANQYEILDAQSNSVGLVAERSGGFLDAIKRLFLRSHRPLSIDVFDGSGQAVLHFGRTFFFFFSDLFVDSTSGQRLGAVHRRFGILYKKYDLLDGSGQVFARIQAPLWRIWTFPLIDSAGQAIGQISKKWSGFLREAFTDSDTFLIDYGNGAWSEPQRAVILAAAISVDFDFFEENQGIANSVTDIFD